VCVAGGDGAFDERFDGREFGDGIFGASRLVPQKCQKRGTRAMAARP
jgi:hypothetical protein